MWTKNKLSSFIRCILQAALHSSWRKACALNSVGREKSYLAAVACQPATVYKQLFWKIPLLLIVWLLCWKELNMYWSHSLERFGGAAKWWTATWCWIGEAWCRDGIRKMGVVRRREVGVPRRNEGTSVWVEKMLWEETLRGELAHCCLIFK